MLIDWHTKGVTLKFFLDSSGLIPRGLIREKEFVFHAGEPWPYKRSGELAIDHKRYCHTASLPEDLRRLGFYFQDAFWYRKDDDRCVANFFLSEYGNPSPQNYLLHLAATMAEIGYWNVWAFKNSGRVIINLGDWHCPEKDEEPASCLCLYNNDIQYMTMM